MKFHLSDFTSWLHHQQRASGPGFSGGKNPGQRRFSHTLRQRTSLQRRKEHARLLNLEDIYNKSRFSQQHFHLPVSNTPTLSSILVEVPWCILYPSSILVDDRMNVMDKSDSVVVASVLSHVCCLVWSVIGLTLKWKSAVDYTRTFEEISSQAVGGNSPRSPRVQSHCVIAGRANNPSMTRVEHAAQAAESWLLMSIDDRTWLCGGQTVTHSEQFLSLKGCYCKLTSMAVGEEMQLPRLTNNWIRNKLLSVPAVCVHPRATTHTKQRSCLYRCKKSTAS